MKRVGGNETPVARGDREDRTVKDVVDPVKHRPHFTHGPWSIGNVDIALIVDGGGNLGAQGLAGLILQPCNPRTADNFAIEKDKEIDKAADQRIDQRRLLTKRVVFATHSFV